MQAISRTLHLAQLKLYTISPLNPRAPVTTVLLSVSVNLTTPGTSQKGDHPGFVLCVRLISPNTESSGSAPALARVRSCFLRKAEERSVVRIDHTVFIHSPTDRPGGSFRASAVGNNAALNRAAQSISSGPWFPCFALTPRSRIAGSCGGSILNSLRSHHPILRSGSATVQSRQEGPRAPRPSTFSPTLTIRKYFFNSSHPQALSQCGSDFHFPNDWWC